MTVTHALWVTAHDLVTHEALIFNDGFSDVEIRSLCGLSSIPLWESLIDDSDITCPKCRAISAVQALMRAA
jgi:hypothetical protein